MYMYMYYRTRRLFSDASSMGRFIQLSPLAIVMHHRIIADGDPEVAVPTLLAGDD